MPGAPLNVVLEASGTLPRFTPGGVLTASPTREARREDRRLDLIEARQHVAGGDR